MKGENPLCIYHYPKLGLYIYASTEAILQHGLSKWHVSTGAPDRLTPICGNILRIDTAGRITTHTFDDTHLVYPRYNGTLWGGTYTWPSTDEEVDQDYVEELKSVDTAFGYSSEDVDVLISEGISPEEIEEYFYSYCGER